MNENEIIKVSKMYPKAFKELDTNLIDKYFAKNATKTGFIYDYDSQKWLDLSTVGIEEIKQWVLLYNKEKIMPESEIDIEILNTQDRIAVVKIDMYWAENRKGCDYLFLVKENSSWYIDKILYQSVL
ncbi:nuclear transport factor 2 family protein [Aquimarina algicola]|uniref:Nuclear transport factor 2 family protein n=1 Tax=Aquimarina algicola TaxID=2589995 RepID=A0A504JGE5_9FLAO|nr:nuclear transport factor 2 family protein [Aquimarina algicola]TPN86828.1 nuclear transport factor 2 family protein [Aquimarina algicola]